MNTSAKKIREFPAFVMTALIVTASLTTTASLRMMTPQKLPSTYYYPGFVYYESLAPEFEQPEQLAASQQRKTTIR